MQASLVFGASFMIGSSIFLYIVALLIVLAAVVATQGAGSFAIKQVPVVDKLIPDALKG